MPIMPMVHLAPDTPDWIRYGIAATMMAYALVMMIGAMRK